MKAITIGPCSHDLSYPQIKGADLGFIRSGRLEVHAWRRPATWMCGETLLCEGASTCGSKLIWKNLADESWDDFLDHLSAQITTEAVWISIDKDVLSPSEAVTNWDQGQMSVDHIAAALGAIATRHNIVGVDICGDYSPPRFADLYRWGFSRFERPFVRFPVADAFEINFRTNARLLSVILGLSRMSHC